MLSAKDILYWTNNFIWTFDPRIKGAAHIPMILFPKQEEFLLFLEQCEGLENDAIVEKSRDMGVTWLCCIFLVHRWLFEDGFKGGIGSRKEDLVDKAGDPDCIFWKIRYIIERLPKWMLPKGYDPRKHSKHMIVINPENGNTITGEAGDNIGRGGRNSVYFIDESAFIEHQEVVDRALSQNTNVRIYVSTPNGNGNPFAQKAAVARKNPNGPIKLFRLHWKEDPRKNYWCLRNPDGSVFADGYGEGPSSAQYPWYEKQKAVLRNPITIAQELDIDYSASIEGVVIPAIWVTAAVGFEEWLWRVKGLRLPHGDREAGYDVSGGTAVANGNSDVFLFRDGPSVLMVLGWTGLDSYLSTKKVVKLGNQCAISVLNYDSQGVGTSTTGNLRSAKLGQLFTSRGINGGGKCTNRQWPDGINPDGTIRWKLSKDKFVNYRAEAWWTLRERFEKVFEYRVGNIEHPLHELISLPDPAVTDQDDHRLLIEQLSLVLCDTGDNGKIKIESKKDMKDRGVDSPDHADSCVYAFAPKKIKKQNASDTSRLQTTSYEVW